MNPNSKSVLTQWLAVVAATWSVVVLAAFVSIPYTLGHQPGTPAQIASAERHLT